MHSNAQSGTFRRSGRSRVGHVSDNPVALERHGITHVSASRRYGKPRNQFSVRFAPVIYLAGIYLGASGGPLGLGFAGSVTAIVLANLLGAIITGWCAVMGPRLGMPQLPMGRAPFGYFGNFLPAILSLLIFIGYYSVGTVLGAKSLANLLHTSYPPTAIVVALLSMLIGIFGYKILHVIGKLITYVSIVVLTAVSIVLIHHGGGPGAQATVAGADYFVAWSMLFTAAFGYTASWAPYASDYSRYLPENSKPASVFAAASAGLFTSTTWMMCLGAGLITFLPNGDALDTFGVALPRWLCYAVLLTLGLSAIPHNSVNLYSGAMATLTCNVRLPQWVTVVTAGVIGLLIALQFGGDHFQANFLLFLHVVSYYITPWVAVMIADYHVVQRAGRRALPVENYYATDGAFGRYNSAGLAALIVGVVISTPFMSNGFYTGVVATRLNDVDVSYFVAGLAAAAIYLVLQRRFAAPDPTGQTSSGRIAALSTTNGAPGEKPRSAKASET
jgi:NCS1 family nucleobase:cation symporter-1